MCADWEEVEEFWMFTICDRVGGYEEHYGTASMECQLSPFGQMFDMWSRNQSCLDVRSCLLGARYDMLVTLLPTMLMAYPVPVPSIAISSTTSPPRDPSFLKPQRPTLPKIDSSVAGESRVDTCEEFN